MTVTNTQTSTGAQAGNGVTTIWPYAFDIPDAASARVTVVDTTVTPAATTVLAAAQYSITGLGTGSGSVTYPLAGSPLAVGQFITVERAAALTQPTALRNQGPYNPATVEAAMDRIVEELQQLATEIAFCLRVDTADPSGAPNLLPTKTIRASMGLAFSGSGQPIAGALPSIPVSNAMAAVFQAVSIAAAVVLLGGPFLATTWCPRNYTSVPVLSNNAVTPNSKVDITAGQCADSTNALMITVAAATIDCGTVGLNGLDVGALGANTWYHAFAICKADGSGGGFIASTSATAPTMPATYTLKRRLGAFSTDGASHIIKFTQFGSQFLWKTPILDVNVAAIGLVAMTPVLSIPLGVRTFPLINHLVSKAGAAPSLYASSPDVLDVTAAANYDTAIGTTASAFSASAMNGSNLRSNTSSQLRFIADTAASVYSVATYGWLDDLGRSA